MADFEITSPDGKKFVVTAPEGATQDQVLAYAQSQFAQKPAPATNAQVAGNAAYKGVAGLVDSVLNTPNNILNLGKAAVGTAAGALGRPDLMPNVTPNPDLARRGMEAVGVIYPNVNPQGAMQKAIDFGVQGAVGGALTGGAGLGRTLIGAGLGATSGLAAGGTMEKTGDPALAATAGMVAPAIAARVPAVIADRAHGLMQSALKPTVGDLMTGKADKAIQTMLDEGINPTRGGMIKLEGLMDNLETKLQTILQQHTGKTVSKGDVASRMQDVVDRIERRNPTPQDALKDVQKVYDDFLTNGLVPRNIPIEQANELKRGLYEVLKKKYGVPVSDDTVNAKKALARGFKETIENQAPEVGPTNAKLGELGNVRNVAERRAMIEGNKNPGGLTWLTHDPMAALGFMADRSALVKALMARGAYQFSGLGDTAPSVANQTSPIVTNSILETLLRNQ